MDTKNGDAEDRKKRKHKLKTKSKMASQDLKDKIGRLLGKIKEENGRFVLYDKIGRKIGSYDPKTNVTWDKNGRKVGTGNLLTTLL